MSSDTAQLTIDRDGFSIEENCHDSNANLHPQAVEYWKLIDNVLVKMNRLMPTHGLQNIWLLVTACGQWDVDGNIGT